LINTEALELLHYDPETGLFTHLIKRGGMAVGSVAGYKNPAGYVRITINYKIYQAHRLAWLYVHGIFPDALVDHIDGCTSNNRLNNLRPASNSENLKNQHRLQSHNTSGFKGVTWHKHECKWMAQAKLNGKKMFLGYFNDPKEASSAYEEFAKSKHGEFYHKI